MRWVAMVTWAAALLAGCTGSDAGTLDDGHDIPYDPPAAVIAYAPVEDLLNPEPDADPAGLRPGDLIEITVHGHPDLATRMRVPADGIVSLPLIGEMSLQGLTIAAARKSIRAALEKEYLVSAPTSILVTQPAPRRFFVLGAVRKPGAYSMAIESPMTLLRAVAEAGGLTEAAERDGILLLRTSARVRTGEDVPRRRLYRLSYSAIASEGQIRGDIQLLPNDTLLVPSRGNVTVLGAVKSAGVFPIPAAGMTLVQAVALAGGPTREAATDSTIVTRPRIDGRPLALRVPLGEILKGNRKTNPILRAGDVVFVPESIF